MPLPENSLPPPSRAALAALSAALLPGSRAVRLRALAGGLDASMHAIDLVPPAGEPLKLVLRRYAPARHDAHAGRLEHGFRVLQLLARAGFPAPRPLLLDPTGITLEAPGYVMTRLPGRGDLQPRNPRRWLQQLAQTLAALHDLPLHRLAPNPLPAPAATSAAGLSPEKRARVVTHPLGAAVLAAVEAGAGQQQGPLERRPGDRAKPTPQGPLERSPGDRAKPTQEGSPLVFCHGDYWPGNTLWRRGRLTGVVDWDDARLDSRWSDVAYCRLDLALYFGNATPLPDLFLHAYEQASGHTAHNLAYWDLQSALRALPDPAYWLPSWEGHTPGVLTAEGVRANLVAFVQAALSTLSGSPPG